MTMQTVPVQVERAVQKAAGGPVDRIGQRIEEPLGGAAWIGDVLVAW
jgi:hypothetical protein